MTCALLAHTPDALQRALNVVTSIYSALGLKVNISPDRIFPHFTYLGSVLSPTCNIDSDIQDCIALASSAFGRLKSSCIQSILSVHTAV